jgi:hypothetical protein
MESAQYLRDRAAQCLAIASLLSDPKAAAVLRTTASDYLARAQDIEAKEASSVPPIKSARRALS